MDAQRLQGMTVVSLDDAERLGQVSEVLFETSPLRIAVLRVDGETGPLMIPFDQVHSVGSDAITIDDSSAARAGGAARGYDDMPGLADLHRLKVVDEDGEFQGTVTALEADPSSGTVSRVEVQRGGVMGMGGERQNISVDSIRSVGTEVVTVRSAV